MNKLCMIIPTCDRADCISYYLDQKAQIFADNGIDLIIYDSSGDDQTKATTRKFVERGFTNIKYVRYDGQHNANGIDEKVFTAAKRYCRQYEYLCFSGDGIIVHLELIWAEACTSKLLPDWNMVIYDNDAHMQVNRKGYCDRGILFQECCWRMTCLSSLILSGDLLESCTRTLSPDHALWLPMALFYTPAESLKGALYLADMRFWTPNANIRESFWKTSGNALHQWGKVWCNAVDALPSEYDRYKDEVLLSHDRYTHIFSIKSLVHLKAYGNITLEKVKHFFPYMPRVTETHPIWFYIVATVFSRHITYILIQFYHLLNRRKV